MRVNPQQKAVSTALSRPLKRWAVILILKHDRSGTMGLVLNNLLGELVGNRVWLLRGRQGGFAGQREEVSAVHLSPCVDFRVVWVICSHFLPHAQAHYSVPGINQQISVQPQSWPMGHKNIALAIAPKQHAQACQTHPTHLNQQSHIHGCQAKRAPQ